MLRADDIEKKTQAADKVLIDQGERYIDGKLEAEWQPNQPVVVGLSLPSRIANHLADMYRQGGWDVNVVTDGREGGYILTFRKAQDNGPYGGYQK